MSRLDKIMFSWYHSIVMGVITEISVQKKDKNRVNVCVDGEFAFALEKLTAVEHGLKTGAEIDEASVLALTEESECERAFRRSVGYIARRMRTEAEIENYLAAKNFSESVIRKTQDKLRKYGYLGDDNFARTYISVYGDRRGKKRIRCELERMGVDEKTVESALGALGDQREAASAAAEKYLRTHDYDYRKLSAHLASKGFEWEDIAAVVRACGKGGEEL